MRTLIMTFQTQEGSRVNYRVANPKEDLTPAEVQSAMQTILARNIFATTRGDLAGIIGAEVVAQQTTAIL